MTRTRSVLAPLPPFLVGLAAAAVGETSATLLLYSTEGFLPALTLILTVEAGAFALGLWSGTVRGEASPVEQIRRRWLFSLVTLSLAAAFSTGMTFMEDTFRGGLGQGLGLGLLGSLPLFAMGSLLAALARGGGPGTRRLSVSAAAGVSAGFLLTGAFLLPNLAPYTLYLVLLSVLSAGALLNGWVLDDQACAVTLEEVPTPRGPARVQDRFAGADGIQWRTITEGGRLRAREGDLGRKGRDWEGAVLAALHGEGKAPGSVLFLGGGGGTLARLLLEAYPATEVLVVEESQAVMDLARKHFQPFPEWDRLQLRRGRPWGTLGSLDGSYHLVVVDLQAVPSLGPVPDIPRQVWDELGRLSGAEGIVVLGGLGHPERLGEGPVKELLSQGSAHYPRCAVYQGKETAFLLLAGSEAPFWSPVLPGFHAISSVEGEGV